MPSHLDRGRVEHWGSPFPLKKKKSVVVVVAVLMFGYKSGEKF